jgi:hypothetical protein
MSDLLMNVQTNDLQITNGDLSLATGTTEIAQNVQQRLQVWLGEWFLNTTIGVPYRQQILVKNPNLDLVQADLISAIVSTPGVTQVLDFSFSYSATNRTLSVQAKIQTSTGQAITIQTQVTQAANATIEGTPY